MSKELTPVEVLIIAGEILQWELPVLMTVEKLNKVKLIAGAAITQTHDHVNQNAVWNAKYRRLTKAKATIAEIVKYKAFRDIVL